MTYNVYAKRDGIKAKWNKWPMTVKEALKFILDIEKSGIQGVTEIVYKENV
jgi:hypothetical protein